MGESIESMGESIKSVGERVDAAWRWWRSVGSPRFVCAPMVNQSELAWRELVRGYGVLRPRAGNLYMGGRFVEIFERSHRGG